MRANRHEAFLVETGVRLNVALWRQVVSLGRQQDTVARWITEQDATCLLSDLRP